MKHSKGNFFCAAVNYLRHLAGPWGFHSWRLKAGPSVVLFLAEGTGHFLACPHSQQPEKNGEIPDSIIRGTYMYFDPRKGILLNRQYWQFKQKRFYKKHFIKFLEINYIIVYTCTLFFINFARRAKCRVDSVSPKDLQNKSQAMKS